MHFHIKALLVFFCITLASHAFAAPGYQALPSDAFIDLIPIDPLPSEILSLNSDTAKKVFMLADGSVQTYWGGTVARGISLKCNGLEVPITPAGIWEFNLSLGPKPTPITFEWSGEIAHGKAQMLVIWKQTPPAFGTKLESGVREDFKIPPYIVLHQGGRLIEKIDEDAPKRKDLFFRVYFPHSEFDESSEWKINFYANTPLSHFTIGGHGRVPSDIPFSAMNAIVEPSETYHYQISIKQKSGHYLSEERAVRVSTPEKTHAFEIGLKFISAGDSQTDPTGANTATKFSSSFSPALRLQLSIYHDPHLELRGRADIDPFSFKAPEGKTFSVSKVTLFSGLAGVRYHLSDMPLSVSALLGLKHYPVVRATSATGYLVERVMSPTFEGSIDYDFYREGVWTAGVEGGLKYHLDKTAVQYTMKSGLGYFAKATVGRNIEDLSLMGALFLSQTAVDTTLVQQSLVETGFELALRFP